MSEGRTLDVDDLVANKSSLRLPYFIMPEINDTLPLIVGLLEPGKVQLVATYNGQQRVVGSISKSAYNVDKILRTQNNLTYVDKKGSHILKGVRDYLEVLQGWIL